MINIAPIEKNHVQYIPNRRLPKVAVSYLLKNKRDCGRYRKWRLDQETGTGILYNLDAAASDKYFIHRSARNKIKRIEKYTLNKINKFSIHFIISD